MALDVRPATVEDIDALRRVSRRAWHAAHAPIVGADTVEEFLADYYDEASFRAAVRDDDTILRVAVDDAPVGFASASPTDGDDATFVLGRIYVLPDRWGEGVGRRLLAAVETAVERRGGERVRLAVMADNDRAVRFYEAAGYVRCDDFYDGRVGTRSYRYVREL